MTPSLEQPAAIPSRVESRAASSSERVTAAAWLAGVSAVVGFCSLSQDASIGTGLGALGISAMVAIVCCYILRD